VTAKLTRPTASRAIIPLVPTLDDVAAYFVAHPGDVVAAYVFGSVARGTAREASDVDVAILLDHDPPRTLDGLCLGLQDDLTRTLGRPVDLVLNRAPVDLVHRVLRDGVIVLDRDRPARLRFEVRARAEWLDLMPYLERYRRGGRAA
jgi:predicted nucleotidyltransferase